MYIDFPANIYTELDGFHLAIYAIMRRLAYAKPSLISQQIISFELFGSPPAKKQATAISTAIKTVANVLSPEPEWFDPKHVIITPDMFIWDGTDTFVSIEYDDILHIVRSSADNKWMLLKYYIVLMSTRISFTNYKVGRSPLPFVANKTGISKRTALRLNQWLEENRLIYVKRTKDSRRTNCYCRYEDRALLA